MALRNCSLNLKHFDQNEICFYLRGNSTFVIEMLSSEGLRPLSWVRRRRIASWKRQRTFTSAQKHAARESYPNFQTRAVDNLKWGQSNFWHYSSIISSFRDSVVSYWMKAMIQTLSVATYLHRINQRKHSPSCTHCSQDAVQRKVSLTSSASVWNFTVLEQQRIIKSVRFLQRLCGNI